MTPTPHSQKPRIAILEDESSMCALLYRILNADYDIAMLKSGRDMINAIKRDSVDLALLDIVLSGENGIEIAKAIRARSHIPVVMLSGLSTAETIVAGLGIGANDYITKPFDPDVLKARVANALRARISETKRPLEEVCYELHGCTVNPWKRHIESPAGIAVKITEMELQLLSLMLRQAPSVVSREELSRCVVGKKWQPEIRALDVHISHLRSKLSQAGLPKNVLCCHRGVGYSIRTANAVRH